MKLLYNVKDPVSLRGLSQILLASCLGALSFILPVNGFVLDIYYIPQYMQLSIENASYN